MKGSSFNLMSPEGYFIYPKVYLKENNNWFQITKALYYTHG